jgi:hypothetical protein
MPDWLIGLLAGCCMIVCGCAGNGAGSTQHPSAGFYRGTLNFHGAAKLPPGATPIVADVEANGFFVSWGRSPALVATMVNRQTDDVLMAHEATMVGTYVIEPSGNSLSFSFLLGTEVAATGTLTLSPPPALGSNVTVPPAGAYRGELVVFSEGRAKAYGLVDATVESDGSWHAAGQGGGNWVPNGHFFGRFEENGTLSDALISCDAGLITQHTPPVYSFDGATLVVRYDTLPLQPASCWITLQRVEVQAPPR